MGRWEPGAGGRLREAALNLYLERGFDQTMVNDIAERAGVTARTFFRYFADKREVLFDAAAELQEKSLAALEGGGRHGVGAGARRGRARRGGRRPRARP